MPVGKAPPIGRLRNYAEIFEWRDVLPHDEADPIVQPDYTSVGHCWCSLRARTGEMWFGAAQIDEQPGPRGTHTIQTRFEPFWTIRHMLEIAGIRYRVVSVSNDDARRFTQLEVEQYGDAAVIGAQQFAHWDRDEPAGESIWDDGDSRWPR